MILAKRRGNIVPGNAVVPGDAPVADPKVAAHVVMARAAVEDRDGPIVAREEAEVGFVTNVLLRARFPLWFRWTFPFCPSPARLHR